MQADAFGTAPAQFMAARGDFVVRRGTFFQVGDYPDKQFSLSEAEADAAIAAFTPVPLNVEHIPTIFDGKLGMVRRIWREGRNILAEYAIPRWLHEVTRGEAIKISSEWGRKNKLPQGGAFVLNPRVADAVMQAAFKQFPAGGQSERAANAGDPPMEIGGVPASASPDAQSFADVTLFAGKEREAMSLLAGIKTLFQRAGVPAHEIDAQLIPAPHSDAPLAPQPGAVGSGEAAIGGEAAFVSGANALTPGAGEASQIEDDGSPAVPLAENTLAAAPASESARFAAMEAELARLRGEAKQAQQDAQNAHDAARFAADTQIIDGWVRGMQMTPAEAEQWRLIAQATPAVFAAAVPALNVRPPLPQLAGFGSAARPTLKASETADADRLEALTRQRMKDKGLEHTAAFKEICGENRDLALSVRTQSQEGM